MKLRASVVGPLLSAALIFAMKIACAEQTAIVEKPYLSEELQAKLQSLPYGLDDQCALFLRHKHIESVQMTASGPGSRFGFTRGQSVMNDGLNMRLTLGNRSKWANSVINLSKPVDSSRYNSLVVWVWASRSRLRFFVQMKGESVVVRSDLLPAQGFQANEPVQLVIPFSRFSPTDHTNLGHITQLTFDYGTETAGNPPRGALQILGVAFIEQTEPLDHAVFVLGRTSTRVVLAEPIVSAERRDEPLVSPLPLAPVAAKPPSAPSAVEPKASLIKPPLKLPSNTAFLIAVLIILPLAFSLVWLFARQRRFFTTVDRLGKVLYEIHWPFSTPTSAFNRKVEREFWEGVASQQERFAWLSTSNLPQPLAERSGHFGSEFLKRQAENAAMEDIHFFPSLSFSNTFFRKDVFPSTMERSSAALRTLVIETILNVGAAASGVRIEDTREWITTKLRRKVRGPKKDAAEAEIEEHEFWADVIATVKAKRPGFLFIADAAGDQAQLISQFGFDYYENDLFAQTVLDQVRSGKVGDLFAFLRGEAAVKLKHSIYNLNALMRPNAKRELDRKQHFLSAVLLTLLPGVVQHDNNLPEDLAGFVNRMGRSLVLHRGKFTLLPSGDPSVLAFARWRKKSLMLAVANFGLEPRSAMVGLGPLQEGFDNNKLYLFNNALHGSSALKNFLSQPETSGPALALWGQNLRENGVPLSTPALSLSLFSVNLSRPINTPLPTPDEPPIPAINES